MILIVMHSRLPNHLHLSVSALACRTPEERSAQTPRTPRRFRAAPSLQYVRVYVYTPIYDDPDYEDAQKWPIFFEIYGKDRLYRFHNSWGPKTRFWASTPSRQASYVCMCTLHPALRRLPRAPREPAPIVGSPVGKP